MLKSAEISKFGNELELTDREEKKNKESKMTKEEKEEMNLLVKKKRLAFLDILNKRPVYTFIPLFMSLMERK